MIRAFLVLVAVVAAVALSACGVLALNIPQPITEKPLIEPLPFVVGVYYSPQMRDYVVRAKLSAESSHKIKRKLGEPSVEMLRRSFEAMFDTVVELEDWPPLGPLDPRIAGVIVPSIEDSEIVFTKIGTTPPLLKTRRFGPGLSR